MRYLMMMKADEAFESGAPPPPQLMAAMDRFMGEMAKAGVLVSAGGLAPSSQGNRIEAKRGKLTTTDGPFAETKELVAGFAIVQAKDRAHAIELAQQFMKVHVDTLGPSYEGICELRPMFG